MQNYQHLIYKSAAFDNVLHLTSKCSQRCLFCSHQFNPPGLAVFDPGHLPLSVVLEAIDLLSPTKKIAIGESVSRVLEGEPFLYPQWAKALSYLRSNFPHNKVVIVSSGSLLDDYKIDFLKTLKQIELKISLNFFDAVSRKKYLQDYTKQDMAVILKKLQQREIPFSISLVALNHLTGISALADTILKAAEFQPREITVFKPAYTFISPRYLIPSPQDQKKLADLIDYLATQIQCPLLLEPAELGDLQAKVAGVYPLSKADLAGVKKDDIILSINGKKPFSRSEAYQQLKSKGGYQDIIVQRGAEKLKLSLLKEKNESSGLLFYADLTEGLVREIRAKSKKRDCLLLTSQLAYQLFKAAFPSDNIQVKAVKNISFGGSIGCSGLLTFQDLQQTLNQIQDLNNYQGLFVPDNMLDFNRRDLWGFSADDFIEKNKVLLL